MSDSLREQTEFLASILDSEQAQEDFELGQQMARTEGRSISFGGSTIYPGVLHAVFEVSLDEQHNHPFFQDWRQWDGNRVLVDTKENPAFVLGALFAAVKRNAGVEV